MTLVVMPLAPRPLSPFDASEPLSDVSADYVAKLKNELEGYLGGALPGAGERDRVKR